MTYIICGIPCIEVCMESDYKKSFFYAGRYFCKTVRLLRRGLIKVKCSQCGKIISNKRYGGLCQGCYKYFKMVERYMTFQQREQSLMTIGEKSYVKHLRKILCAIRKSCTGKSRNDH